MKKIYFILFIVWLFSTSAFAVMDSKEFENIRTKIRHHHLISFTDGLAMCNKYLLEQKTNFSQSQIITILNYKAWFLIELGEYKKAIFVLSDIKSRVPKSTRPFLFYAYYNLSGGLYFKLELYEESLKHHLQAYDIAKKHNKERFIYQTKNNIAEVYTKLKRYDEAISFSLSYINYLTDLKSTNYLSWSVALINLSTAYLGNQELTLARQYIFQALALQEKQKSPVFEAYSYHILGKISIAQGHYDEAESQINKSITILLDEKSPIDIAKIKLDLVKVYQAQSRYDEAFSILENILGLALDLDKSFLIVDITDILIALHQKLKHFQKALEAVEYRNKAIDIIHARQNKVSLAQAQAEIDLSHKDLLIEHLNQENILQSVQQEYFQNIVMLIALFVLILIVFLAGIYWHIRRKNRKLMSTIELLKKTQNQLIESKKMASLGSLVAGVSHEINTPIGLSLTGISHFEYTVAKIEEKFLAEELEKESFAKFLTDSKKIAKTIDISLRRAANLVKSFKLAAVDQSHETLRTFDLVDYLHEIMATLTTKMEKSPITFETNHELKSILIKSFPGSWAQVFTNLIQNSLIHGFDSDQTGCVLLKLAVDNEELVYIFKDNGKGMSKETQSKIFEPFFTTNREQGGSGLGLHILYNIVTQKLKGNVTVDSKLGEGTTFTIRTPLQLIG